MGTVESAAARRKRLAAERRRQGRRRRTVLVAVLPVLSTGSVAAAVALAGSRGPSPPRRARYLVYVPDSQGDGVYVIDPERYRVIDYFHTGAVVEHVVPAWNL